MPNGRLKIDGISLELTQDMNIRIEASFIFSIIAVNIPILSPCALNSKSIT